MRAALIAFLILSAFVGAFIPFDERIRGVWAFAFGYCAFLAVASIGLVRLGRRALWLLGVPAAVALTPGVVGFALMFRSLDSDGVWLQASLYLFYALAAWGICLVVRGWALYFTQSHDNAAKPRAAANPAVALWSSSTRTAGRVAEPGLLGVMKRSTRIILWGVLLTVVSINTVLLFTALRPPVRLEVVDRYPARRIQFANDTGRAMNFFFFTEVQSNGTWVSASPQPKGARGANGVKPHSIREFEIAPAPNKETAWRLGFTYQAAVAPWYLEWPNQFGLLKNSRERYFDKKTVYTEFAQ